MRVAFAGTPEFASAALAALGSAGHELVLVLTQPDRPAGRGMHLQASPVKALALSQGWAVAQPRSLRLDGKFPDDAEQARQALVAARPDVLVVAAYGLLLPQWVLDLPRHGCINIHASLLPRWRGAAPIHRAIEAGDLQSGITLMQMDIGLDTGDMLAVEATDILPGDTTATLHDRLAGLGAGMVVQALAQLQDGRALPRAVQPELGVCYAHKIEKAEAQLDWTQPAALLERRVRAFNPFPVAHTSLRGELIKVWGASAAPDARPGSLTPPGTVLCADEHGVVVAARDSLLTLTQLQRAGGKRLVAAEFLRGCPISAGVRLGEP